jgi:hypothetical protein
MSATNKLDLLRDRLVKALARGDNADAKATRYRIAAIYRELMAQSA